MSTQSTEKKTIEDTLVCLGVFLYHLKKTKDYNDDLDQVIRDLTSLCENLKLYIENFREYLYLPHLYPLVDYTIPKMQDIILKINPYRMTNYLTEEEKNSLQDVKNNIKTFPELLKTHIQKIKLRGVRQILDSMNIEETVEEEMKNLFPEKYKT